MMGEWLHRNPAFGPGISTKRRGWAIFALAGCLGLTVPANAQGQADTNESEAANSAEPNTTEADADLDERAQRHWGSGMAYLEEGDYPRALEAFNKAYGLSGRPRILVAIAVAHERRGDLLAAIAALDEYLRLAPTAANAQELTQLRADLAQRHEQQVRHMGNAKNQEATAPPTQDDDLARPPAASSQERGSHTRTHDSRSSRSVWKWSALGVGVASGVAATVSGLLALQKYDELEASCGTARVCTRQETQTGTTMAWVSTALTGVAVVGLGVGFWLILDEPSASSSDSPPPSSVHVGLNCYPSGLTSDVTWRF